MCGIAGVFDASGRMGADGVEAAARRMAGALAHRGPDGEGVWCDPEAGVGLAHTRLAILDVSSSGAQPMPSQNGRWVLCYNGEIYNFEELRGVDALQHVSWRGRSDTEVVVESIARRGLAETVRSLNGMFAFAAYDREERVLHLVRDRIGIKPLFLRPGQGGVPALFGSELKALTAVDSTLEIDPDSVAAFLRFGYVPGPSSIWQGVEKVLPGQIVSLRRDGTVERYSYWSLEPRDEQGLGARSGAMSDQDAIDQLEELLQSAVSRQMVADVPLGAFLSGGIDSSLVVALMSRIGSDVRTFSIGFGDPRFDESGHASRVAEHLGTRHTRLEVGAAEALSVVPDLWRLFDEPLADASQIPTYLLASLTRNHVTVALSGDGGDELFGGYERYRLAAAAPMLERVPRALRSVLGRGLALAPRVTLDRLETRFSGLPRRLSEKADKLAAVLALQGAPLYERLVSHIPDPETYMPGRHPKLPIAFPKHGSLFDAMRYADIRTYMVDGVLQKVDRASMAASLEVRPPLLDERIVDFAWGLPHDLLFRSGRGKWILRELLARHVPREMFERPKSGFSVPLSDWLRGPLRDWARDLIEGSEFGGGLVAQPPARKLLQRHLAGEANLAYQLWPLLTFEAWRRAWT